MSGKGAVTIRSWHEFIDTRKFKLPKNKDKLWKRVQSNTIYYQGNYLVLVALGLLFLCVTHPLILLPIFTLVIGFRHISLNPAIQVAKGKYLNREQATVALGVVVTLLLFLTTGLAAFQTFLFCGAAIVLHASFRTSSVVATFSQWKDHFLGRQSLVEELINQEESDEDPSVSKEEEYRRARERSERRQQVQQRNDNIRQKYNL
eukprot:Colp12_sorted_trinity150504_noHs@23269